MKKGEWKLNDKKFIGTLYSSNENGIFKLYGKKINGVWCYAVIRNYFTMEQVIAEFNNGKGTFNTLVD